MQTHRGTYSNSDVFEYLFVIPRIFFSIRILQTGFIGQNRSENVPLRNAYHHFLGPPMNHDLLGTLWRCDQSSTFLLEHSNTTMAITSMAPCDGLKQKLDTMCKFAKSTAGFRQLVNLQWTGAVSWLTCSFGRIVPHNWGLTIGTNYSFVTTIKSNWDWSVPSDFPNCSRCVPMLLHVLNGGKFIHFKIIIKSRNDVEHSVKFGIKMRHFSPGWIRWYKCKTTVSWVLFRP